MNIEQTLRILMGAFLVQGLLAIITWWPSGGGPVEARDLVPVDAAELDSITILGTVQRGEAPDEPLVLKRGPDGWTLPAKFDAPVPDDKMERLFETIDKLEVRRPIASNAYRHADLDVAEDQHTRELVLDTGEGEPITVYLGSATGSAAHVRVKGENDVYRVRGVTGYSIQATPTSYFDTQVLKVDSAIVDDMTVRRPDGSAFTFTKTDGGWDVSVPGAAGRELDQNKAAQFVTRTLSVRMIEPHGTTATPEMGFDRGAEVTWSATEDGATVTGRYVVGSEIGDSGRYYLQVDGKPFVYEVLGSQVDNATTKTLDTLFVVR